MKRPGPRHPGKRNKHSRWIRRCDIRRLLFSQTFCRGSRRTEERTKKQLERNLTSALVGDSIFWTNVPSPATRYCLVMSLVQRESSYSGSGKVCSTRASFSKDSAGPLDSGIVSKRWSGPAPVIPPKATHLNPSLATAIADPSFSEKWKALTRVPWLKRLQAPASDKFRSLFLVRCSVERSQAVSLFQKIQKKLRSGYVEPLPNSAIFLMFTSLSKAKKIASLAGVSWVGLYESNFRFLPESSAIDSEEIVFVLAMAPHRKEFNLGRVCMGLGNVLHAQGIEARLFCTGINSISVVLAAQHAAKALDVMRQIPRVICIEQFAQPELLRSPKRKFIAGIPPGQAEKPALLTHVPSE